MKASTNRAETKVWINAAERVHVEHHILSSVGHACGHFTDSGFAPKWKETMPGFDALIERWKRVFGFGWPEDGFDNDDQRAIALCFMAAMVEAGDA